MSIWKTLAAHSLTVALISGTALLTAPVAAADEGRRIIISYDAVSNKLESKVNNRNENNDEDAFITLKQEDKVSLVLKAKKKTTLSINYTIEGEDREAQFIKRFSGALGGDSEEQDLGQDDPANSIKRHVTERLLPGGTLTVEFVVINLVENPTPEDTLRVVFTFNIEQAYPFFFVSTGLVLTAASEHSLSLIRTDSLATVANGSEPQETPFRALIIKGDNKNLRPIESAVTFFHGRIFWRFYGSLGVQLNASIFELPLLGVSYYGQFRNFGYVLTAGLHRANELEIRPESGIEVGQLVHPSANLNEEDIPTEEVPVWKCFIGVSITL